ncbi:hypothetical protein [Cellulomonas sp. PhB143]|uniref:hypothetical protein n=1 Tax=Cellulomonas sp. PhB143 TaxID=2485186 RepID=UPI000F4952FC|nr:hypothetical protein [Cellulomonas sp. PhB143]
MTADDLASEATADAVQPNPSEYLPAGDVLGSLKLLPLPEGTSPSGVLAFVKLDEPDGSVGWSVRVTEGMNDEENLGLLAGYVEHLKQVAAASWDDSDPT